jgi:hypothetical protein
MKAAALANNEENLIIFNLQTRYILVLFSTASSDLKLCDRESRLRVP